MKPNKLVDVAGIKKNLPPATKIKLYKRKGGIETKILASRASRLAPSTIDYLEAILVIVSDERKPTQLSRPS